jgi:hypothetical protein
MLAQPPRHRYAFLVSPDLPQPTPAPELLPEGRRWGRGADSVVPYLAQSLRARAGTSNPVFRDMAAWLSRSCTGSATRALQ